MGAEEVRDIVNDYDPVSYRLPYEVETPYFRLCYRQGEGITAFVDKRPGVDQLPGTCMEFYMSDDGAVSVSPRGSVLIGTRDVPLLYMGSMEHHPIHLYDGKAENNARPLYSWVMNNNWETNFKMDLSGFCQYDYSLWLADAATPEAAMDALHKQLFDPYVLIVR